MAKGQKTGGRKTGTPNRVNAATRDRIEKDADPIGFLCRVVNGEKLKAAPAKEGTAEVDIYPTLDQRLSAAQTLARKVQPDVKDTPIRIELPKISTAKDMASAIAVVVSAVAKGDITPSEGQAVASVIEAQRKVIETSEIEARIAALERKAQQ